MSELVSIIIPVYNSTQFLKESLESVINQTYSNIEIICVNDGSTDDSLEILKQYSNKIIIISQENKGLASALNSGIKQMTGSWFKWFSPDDIMHPNTIEILVNEAKRHSVNTIIYSNWNIINDKGNFLREFHESNYNDLGNFNFGIRLLDNQQINVNTSLIPFNLFKEISFRDLSDPVMIDYDFFLRSTFVCGYKFHLISKPLINYRIHSNQLSHKNISKTLDSVKEIKNELLSNLSIEIKDQTINSLRDYQKNKPIKNKLMIFCLYIMKYLPITISNKLLIFYLNNIRKNR